MPDWRKIIGLDEPDLNMRDIEILLRGFAMLTSWKDYRSSMVGFLNNSSRKFKGLGNEQIEYLEKLFNSFLESCSNLPERAFYLRTTNKFNISMYEAVFFAQCDHAFNQTQLVKNKLDYTKLESLKKDSDFLELGNMRNCLVHQNYASYLIDKTAKEVYGLYQKAAFFIQCLSEIFDNF